MYRYMEKTLITKNDVQLLGYSTMTKGDLMNKIIKVTDENGHTYSSTYVKRAKGLVKNNRAYWVDDKSICLKMPHKKWR